jgi:hypothetical protein
MGLPARRLVRRTQRQLESRARWLVPGAPAPGMAKDPLQTNYEYAENLGFSTANFAPYVAWVGQVAELTRLTPHTIVDCAQNQTPVCRKTGAQAFAAKAFDGMRAPGKLTWFSDSYEQAFLDGGVGEASVLLTDLVLSSPHFAFRDEVRVEPGGALPSATRLSVLAEVLSDASPAQLGLSVDAPHAQAVEAALATQAAKEKLQRFFLAWLEVRAPDEFTLASQVFPQFTPSVAAGAVDETKQFLAHALASPAPSLKSITQATRTMLTPGGAPLYGRSVQSAQLAEVDATQRLGILTHPAVIASHSGPNSTRLVKRGVFFTRKVMCLDLGAPPGDVGETPPAFPQQTERAHIESVTAGPRCMGCHQMINPFGFMQENYEATGEWRTQDHGHPIDASIKIDFLDERPLTAKSPVEALLALTNSARFKQCFIRQLFRFYLQRDETPADAPVLRQMFLEFARDDRQDIVQALRVLANSNRLTHRQEAP